MKILKTFENFNSPSADEYIKSVIIHKLILRNTLNNF